MRHDDEQEAQARLRAATLISQFQLLDSVRQELILRILADLSSRIAVDEPTPTHEVAATLQ